MRLFPVSEIENGTESQTIGNIRKPEWRMLAFYFKKLTNRLTLMVKKILLSLIGVLVFAAGAFAQAKQVRGSVVDENGAAVIGASVIVKGTTIGVSTDQQGFFVMNNVPAKSEELQISYLGYVTQDVKIRPNMQITLVPDEQTIESVVVTGMTKTDKRLFTGAADRLSADDVKLSGMADISRGLEGRSAGVSVQNVSGTFGTAPKIRVRGATPARPFLVVMTITPAIARAP